jgi:hypothetical protein
MTETKPEEFSKTDMFEYVLSSPIQFAMQGQMQDTNILTIVSPPVVNMRIKSFELSQMIHLATMQSATVTKTMQKHGVFDTDDDTKLLEEKKKEEKKKEETPEELSQGIRFTLLNSELNLEKAIDKFKELALAGCVLINNDKINFLQWDSIPESDKMEIFFQFIGVFIMPSLYPESLMK